MHGYVGFAAVDRWQLDQSVSIFGGVLLVIVDFLLKLAILRYHLDGQELLEVLGPADVELLLPLIADSHSRWGVRVVLHLEVQSLHVLVELVVFARVDASKVDGRTLGAVEDGPWELVHLLVGHSGLAGEPSVVPDLGSNLLDPQVILVDVGEHGLVVTALWRQCDFFCDFLILR